MDAEYQPGDGYRHETRQAFFDRLRKVGARDLFDDQRREICEREGLDMGEAFRMLAPEFGYQVGPVPPQYRRSPDVDELKLLQRELMEKRAQAGGDIDGNGMADTQEAWETLSVAVQGRTSTSTKEVRWVGENLLTPVHALKIEDIPSATALALLHWARDKRDDFFKGIFQKVIARDQERDELLSTGVACDEELIRKAKSWAKDEVKRIDEREKSARSRTREVVGSGS